MLLVNRNIFEFFEFLLGFSARFLQSCGIGELSRTLFSKLVTFSSLGIRATCRLDDMRAIAASHGQAVATELAERSPGILGLLHASAVKLGLGRCYRKAAAGRLLLGGCCWQAAAARRLQLRGCCWQAAAAGSLSLAHNMHGFPLFLYRIVPFSSFLSCCSAFLLVFCSHVGLVNCLARFF